jgi:uncharacterized protein (TIGR00303 family)
MCGFRVYRGDLGSIDPSSLGCIYTIASTRTSTIPGISIAGATPHLTLYTPALDVEYLVIGKARSLNVIPVTPDGIPTPAVLTRACLSLLGSKVFIVDSGSYVEPMVTHFDLSSRVVGGSIDSEQALEPGTSERLFREARILGRLFGGLFRTVLIGESMPGGTTTAMAILSALGHRASVSSASRDNPLDLKRRIVSAALTRITRSMDIYSINDRVGDPLHISIAGIAVGVLEKGSRVILAGGTQMAAVVAIAKRIRGFLDGVTIATTRWVINDRTADLTGMIEEIAPETGLAYLDIDLSSSPYPGLRKYEEGYVKEGVGAGGTCFMALLRGHNSGEVLEAIYREYRGVAIEHKAKPG